MLHKRHARWSLKLAWTKSTQNRYWQTRRLNWIRFHEDWGTLTLHIRSWWLNGGYKGYNCWESSNDWIIENRSGNQKDDWAESGKIIYYKRLLKRQEGALEANR